jgi:hypothetical protein
MDMGTINIKLAKYIGNYPAYSTAIDTAIQPMC